MRVLVGPSGREHNAGGQRGCSPWRSHTGRLNNEHTLFSQWAGSALQTIGPSLSSSAMSDNDHVQQQQPPSASLLTYMSTECDSHHELQEVLPGYHGDGVCSCTHKKKATCCIFPAAAASCPQERNASLLFFYMLCCKNQHRSAPKSEIRKKKNQFEFF